MPIKDRRIISNFPWSNMSIEEVGQSGQRKNPKRRRKKMRMAQGGRVVRLKSGVLALRFMAPRLGANETGTEASAKTPATSAP
jgi:hypothetical protein